MEEENFASLNAEIVAETSGTSVTPQLVQVLPGKCGVGVVFVIKIANVYFEMYQKQKFKKFLPIFGSQSVIRSRFPRLIIFAKKTHLSGTRYRLHHSKIHFLDFCFWYISKYTFAIFIANTTPTPHFPGSTRTN